MPAALGHCVPRYRFWLLKFRSDDACGTLTHHASGNKEPEKLS
jgi:hypothetical protein